MNQDVFNMSMRKFLKRVGVTSQRELENAIQGALSSGALSGKKAVKVTMKLTIEGLDTVHTVEDDIALE